MRPSIRISVAAASLLLLVVYVAPLWRIELIAPQYPEGLGLRIWVNQITGLKPNDLNSINGLNHYIGMRAIEPEMFPELKVMPWLVATAVAAGLLVALVGRRGPLYLLALGIAGGALAGLYDFHRWGWDYGHHLDPHAAIKVPGMSYEPPLIGSKQLLNFQATSWPDLGGWIAIVAVGVIVAAAAIECRRAMRLRTRRYRGVAGDGAFAVRVAPRLLAIGAAAGFAASCGAPAARPIAYGKEVCRHCHMTIADARFAAQLVTVKGMVYVFDDVGCLAAFVESGKVPAAEVHSMWVNDFLHPDASLEARDAAYLRVDSLQTPMGSHLVAFRPADATKMQGVLGGDLVAWDHLEDRGHGD